MFSMEGKNHWGWVVNSSVASGCPPKWHDSLGIFFRHHLWTVRTERHTQMKWAAWKKQRASRWATWKRLRPTELPGKLSFNELSCLQAFRLGGSSTFPVPMLEWALLVQPSSGLEIPPRSRFPWWNGLCWSSRVQARRFLHVPCSHAGMGSAGPAAVCSVNPHPYSYKQPH